MVVVCLTIQSQFKYEYITSYYKHQITSEESHLFRKRRFVLDSSDALQIYNYLH